MKRFLVVVSVVLAVLIVYRVFLADPRVTNADPVGEKIVCFGDSLTFGTGAKAESSYPVRLARLIGRDVVNAGVPGDTTASALQRIDDDLLALEPRIVLITLGGNDLMRDVPHERAFENLETIVRSIQDRGALVVMGGIEVPMFDRGYARAYRNLCRETGCLLIPNVLDGIQGNPRLMADRIHPNADGYAVMADTFHEAVRPYL